MLLGASPDMLPPTPDPCLPNPCQNQAICRIRGDSYSCFCVPGFQGSHCQIDVNECVSQPCRNGATCVDRVGRFSCLCPPGFTGVSLCVSDFITHVSVKGISNRDLKVKNRSVMSKLYKKKRL